MQKSAELHPLLAAWWQGCQRWAISCSRHQHTHTHTQSAAQLWQLQSPLLPYVPASYPQQTLSLLEPGHGSWGPHLRQVQSPLLGHGPQAQRVG